MGHPNTLMSARYKREHGRPIHLETKLLRFSLLDAVDGQTVYVSSVAPRPPNERGEASAGITTGGNEVFASTHRLSGREAG